MSQNDKNKQLEEALNDFEAQQNIVGLFDVLFKVAKRNPKLWAEINKKTND